MGRSSLPTPVGNQLRKVRIDGGAPVILAEATNSVGADWSEEGRIVFSDDEGTGLRVVSDQGGEAEDIGQFFPDSISFSWPQWVSGTDRIMAGGPATPTWCRSLPAT